MSDSPIDLESGLFFLGSPCDATGTHGQTVLGYNFKGQLGHICTRCHVIVEVTALDDLDKEDFEHFQHVLRAGVDELDSWEDEE